MCQKLKLNGRQKTLINKTDILGKCICIYEPRGDHGLEGYQLNDTYLFQICYDKKGKYYRVFPTEETDYYETCGPIIFKKYFKEI
jgi:hypothetical protein